MRLLAFRAPLFGRRSSAIALAATAIAAAACAIALFPRALPIVALDQRLTRELALQRADSFTRAHQIAPGRTRTAVLFAARDSLLTFIDLAGGGKDSLDALVRGRDVAPYTWSVRAFAPRDVHESHVELSPDGRIIGFSRTFAEADVRPAVDADSGRRLAEHVLADWMAEPVTDTTRWRLAASSYETRKASGRVDRTYTYERADRRVAGAPIRMDVVIAGDTPSAVRPYVDVPQSFQRRYGEMRSTNDLLALVATIGIFALVIGAALTARFYARARSLRWRPALIAGGVIGSALLAAGLNELPGSWYGYDTAMSPVVFSAGVAGAAIAMGIGMALVLALTLVAAEAAARHAFPEHLDWWKLWRYRGTREVAGRVAGAYVVVSVSFAYVAAFYVVTRNVFGWWVPAELLDDPNLIASPMPWLSGIAMSLQAGVWEEALFRALPLSLLALWAARRPHRGWWMAAGVIVTAVVFGLAHSNYPSWPAYSRPVEIFLDACFWAVLFLQFGLIVSVLAHFLYDAVLFGIFATSGTATEYRVTAVIILLALLAPALAVAWKWIAQRGFTSAPVDARFAAWTPMPETEAAEAEPAPMPGALTQTARRAALVAGAIAAVVALGLPEPPVLGPRFTASRSRVLATADSALHVYAADAGGFARLATTAFDTLPEWRRFLREQHAEQLAAPLAETFHPPAWWVVRYVHTGGTAADRAEEWRVRVRPDGRWLDLRHILPDSARRDSVDATEARRLAAGALVHAGILRTESDASTLKEAKFDESKRPARRDVTITYTDTSVTLPGGAAARVWVTLAGNEPLVARRGVELPEEFLRRDRDRQSARLAIAALFAALLIAGIVGGAVFVTRRRAAFIHDGVLGRRTTFIALGTFSALSVAASLNTLPETLAQYDTETTWGNFVATTAVQSLFAVLLPLITLGLWQVTGALRQIGRAHV
jgi:hypothetical protein